MLVRGDFAGFWRMERHIDDRHSDQRGVFHGQAHLAKHGAAGLTYREAGQLRWNQGRAMRAERGYLWTFAKDHVAVTFEDGAAFHSFVPDGDTAGTDHPCGDDFYTVRYDFTTWPEWRMVWTVTGPRKDYVSYTKFMRIQPRRK